MSRTQLHLLLHDAHMVQTQIASSERLRDAIGDLDDLVTQNYVNVIADLSSRAVDCALGLGNVLENRNRVPSLVLVRALIEASVNLKYLSTLENPRDGALILRAHSLIKWIEMFGAGNPDAKEWEDILDRMPLPAVQEARRRAEASFGWTGKPVRQLCTLTNFKPYEVYKYLSTETHGGLVGWHSKVHRTSETEGHFIFGNPLTEREVESTANMGRRTLLEAFKAAWFGLGEAPFALPTVNPNDWVANTD